MRVISMSNKTRDVSEADWEDVVLDSTTPVLVDFWAEWCGPCKMVAPIVNEIADEYDGKLRVVKVDADANPELVITYNVMGIPSLLLFKDGVVIDRVTGYKPKAQILSKFA
jgi:thioredoxin 1